MRWVIKLGGSLYSSEYLIKWLDIIGDSNSHDKNLHNIIIVPGGGPFADLVRDVDKQFNLDQVHAHNMAVLSMQQYGTLMASLCPTLSLASTEDEIFHCWQEGKAVIWVPYDMVSRDCALEKSWQVTSDSLAAWLAKRLSADHLLFVKSAEITLSKLSIEELVEHRCIDVNIGDIIAKLTSTVQVLHKSQVNQLIELLNESEL